MRKARMRGFTILELMAVIGIVSVLAGVACIGHDIIYKDQIASITRELHADIQSARMNSVTQSGKGFGIRFESPTSYVLFQFNDCNNDFNYDTDSCVNGSREEAKPIRKTVPSSVVLSKSGQTNDLDNNVVIFDKFGQPRQKNWGMGMMTILVRNQQYPGMIRCISISMNRVRESIWNGSTCI